MNLTRKEKRALSTKLSKQYKLSKNDALSLHEASILLSEDKISSAVNKANEVAEKNPDNIHPWMLLGESALKILDHKMAKVFFNRVIDINHKYALAYSGLAKSYFLNSEIDDFLKNAELSMNYYVNDESLISLYIEIQEKMCNYRDATSVLTRYIKKKKNINIISKLADLSMNFEFFDKAAELYKETYDLEPNSKLGKNNLFKYYFLTGLYEKGEEYGEFLYKEYKSDDIVAFLMLIYRFYSKYDEAASLFDSHNFKSLYSKNEAKFVKVIISQDKGNRDETIQLFEDVLSDEKHRSHNQLKSYGAFLLRERQLQNAMPYWKYRNNRAISLVKVLPHFNEKKDSTGKLIVIGEQGIGDYIALMPTLNKLYVPNEKIELYTYGNRTSDMLKLNQFGIKVYNLEDSKSVDVDPENDSYAYLGDFVDSISEKNDFGGFIRLDAKKENKYKKIFSNKKIIGISWKTTNNYTRYYRSIPFEKLISKIPDDWVIINLQYGDISEEIKLIEDKYPQKTFFVDEDVDQMKNMVDFVYQVNNMNKIITIDNTTAHVAGALGHENTDVFIPRGAENMWYWGLKEANQDPWYGNLNLLRQKQIGSWDSELDKLVF
jgi:tetratricopeptide (TPR) repeat protein